MNELFTEGAVMSQLNTAKIIFTLVIFLFLSVTEILACVCSYPPDEKVEDAVKREVENSSAIFIGKVVGFEWRKGDPRKYGKGLFKDESGNAIEFEMLMVKLKVEKVWKGEASSEIFLATEMVRYTGGRSMSSCDYGFKEGEIYLVYAVEKEEVLQTHACTRTRPLSRAEEDLQILGEGKDPIEKKEEHN